jgi:azurin
MNRRRTAARAACSLLLSAAGLLLVPVQPKAAALSAQREAPPRILLDQPERIVEYQLNRLTRDQLVAVERHDTDPRYRPVYQALLRRDGIPTAITEEAVAALVKLGAASPTAVFLDALARLAPEASATADLLTRQLLQQPIPEIDRPAGLLADVLTRNGAATFVTAAAYAAIIVTTPDTAALWTGAASREGHLEALLQGAALLPASSSVARQRARFADLILKALPTAALADPAPRAAALSALAALQTDAVTAQAIVAALRETTDTRVRAAAVRALSGPAASRVPVDQIEPIIGTLARWVESLDPADRASPEVLDALSLAEALAGRLPAARAAATRNTVRSLGSQVIRIGTLSEQVSFDVRWFAVEAGRPVQIVFANTDAMPHNVVIGTPGSLETIGTAASAMTPLADPNAKAFVPDLPEVLFSTRLLQQHETLVLGFTAPTEPAAYEFVCTFPGHWIRMYGVMLVVPNLEAWEARPTVPLDPMTRKPFTQRLVPR